MPKGVWHKPRPTLKDRFWSKVKVLGPDECWEWQAAKSKRGYGQILINRAAVGAHRVSWFLTNGEIPNGMDILHKCDNPPCVNPNHLYPGDQVRNNMDKVERNRQHRPIGEKNPKSKLSYDQVDEIRVRLSLGEKVSKIADDFGVKWNAVWRIKRGIYWNA